MDLHYLKIFNVVATYESYTKASEKLCISQPALSIQIKKLEEELELKLFDKAGNRIILNENGKILFSYTEKIFMMLEEVQNKLTNKKSCIGGTINVGGSNTPGAYILPHVIGDFKREYPQVTINLHISSTDKVAQRVEEGRLDFAVNGGEIVYNNHIIVERLMEDELVLAVSPRNIYCKNRYITPQELKNIKFILHEENSQLSRVTKALIEEFGLPIKKIEMTLGNIDAIKQAVMANLGVSLIPHAAITLERDMGVIRGLQMKDKKWTYPYNLIYSKNRYLSPAALEFMKMIRSKLKSEEC